jgi:nucleolar protein 56
LAIESFEQRREEALKETKEKIKSAYTNEEFALVQAINAYLETVKSYNLLYERLAEWYGIYYPEIKVGSQEMLAELALVLNDKDKISKEGIKAVVKDEKKSSEIYDITVSTIGREMSQNERKAVARFALLSKEMKETLDELDAYINNAARSLMPNVTYMTDEKVAAELLSKAGSLERLATMPASTIQLLGAEKALFKHLKFGSKPPKYGVLFKLTEVGGARRELRGRIARAYATKLAIAARADAFSKRFIAKELKETVNKNIKGMRVRKKEPWSGKAPRKEGGAAGAGNERSNQSQRPRRPQNFRP